MDKLSKRNGVVINNDTAAYDRYMTERNKLKAANNEMNILKTRITKLESEMEDVKVILKRLIER